MPLSDYGSVHLQSWSQYLLLHRTCCILYQLPPLLLAVFWIMWAGKDNRGRCTDSPYGCYPVQTMSVPTSIIHPFLRQMPFPSQPSKSILAWDRHQIMLACTASGFVNSGNKVGWKYTVCMCIIKVDMPLIPRLVLISSFQGRRLEGDVKTSSRLLLLFARLTISASNHRCFWQIPVYDAWRTMNIGACVTVLNTLPSITAWKLNH